MREPYTKLFVHLVWTTWDRMPAIDSELERVIYACILDKCLELKCEALAIGGIEDHVHLLAEMRPSVCVSTLVGEVKGASSHLVNHALRPGVEFKWQGAYGAFSVSERALPKVEMYVRGQKEHHRNRSVRADWERTFIEDE
jgi:REP element-mobilizing transposase RayT